jgi:ParB-like chromosome segregation protein Spo0J
MTIKVTRMRVESLVEDPRNARTHDERNLEQIRLSIAAHGQVEPLLVQRSTSRLIAGHGRLAAMRALGIEDAAVVLLDVDDAEAEALAIRLNRTAELASWDASALRDALGRLDLPPEVLGFDAADLRWLGWAEDGGGDGGGGGGFPVLDPAGTAVEHTCPKCGFQW